ncbi:RDD family protein [Meiothermus granaticius NBRC 107808]|uniref:RDD family protein n=2 Tax=Meiothermus TaxID=65551 RepID=A0A399F4K7_9DEIN|nr:RDD family protein [Meiothermus granaticius NBRC 107808]
MSYASVRRRFAAYLVDWIFKGLLALGITASVEQLFPTSSLRDLFDLGFFALAFFAYEIVPIHTRGATLGKRLLGIRVVGAEGRFISLWHSFMREVIGKWISGLFFGLGYLWAIWDRDKQAWHDKLVQTHVIRSSGRARS